MFRKPAQVAARAEAQVEELFMQHYDRMLEWALHLTEHRAEQAEDLVHDAFVQLSLSPPDFAAIENLDGYLYVVLRNLYRSQLQRATRGPGGPASAVDYDSAEAGLKAADPRHQLQAVEELRLVCRYACARKESSKSGSALILRFFHGYYPGEIAALMLISRAAVKELLRMARAEAKLFLDNPAKLGFIAELTTENDPEIKTGAMIDETISGLRRAIFASRQGRCLERKHLGEIYDAGRPELLTAPALGHIVSCQTCLEDVNRLLRLPPLSDRDPHDMLGPDRGAQANGEGGAKTPPPFGSGSKARARQNALKKYRRRLCEVYEHDPAELRIAVNGFVLARQEVSAAVNKQTLGIEVADDLALIEVLSEQGVRLLALHVEPPPVGQFEQRARAELSDGRIIEANLSFCGSWPHLEVIYECGVRSAECGMEEATDSSGDSPQLLFASFPKSQGLFTTLKSATHNPQSAIKWLLRPVTITALLAGLLIAVVVGQKLGWWLAPAKPAATPTKREARPGKPTAEPQPSRLPSAEPKVSATNAVTLPSVTLAASPAAAPIVATAGLEIEALRLLQQAEADTHEQVEVRRTPPGKLRIEGILETAARKSELLQALASLRDNPAVEIHMQTVAEAAQKLRPPSSAQAPTVIEREEVTVTKLPMDAELRRYFVARGLAEERLDEEITRFAAVTLQRSRQMARHAGALHQLAQRFSATQMQTLDPSAREKWLSLARSHARSLRDETLQLRASLAPLLAGNASPITETITINHDDKLRHAGDRVAQLCAESDRVVRASFTVSTDAAPAASMRASNFLNNLHRIEHLAEAISAAK
jgi:RNA polymerase sigma factor (sigma-70 family)